MNGLSIQTTFHEPISSLQITSTNTPVTIDSKVKTSKQFLKHYIASYFNHPLQLEETKAEVNSNAFSLTEPNQSHAISPQNKFNSRAHLIKAKTTMLSSFPGKPSIKLPPLKKLTKSFKLQNTIEESKPKQESSSISPANKRQKLAINNTIYSHRDSPMINSKKQPICERLLRIIQKCDKGIKEVEEIGEAIDIIKKSNKKSEIITALKRQQRTVQNEKANLFQKSNSQSISDIEKVEKISSNYAFKNRSNYIEEYNYYSNGDDNYFIFNQDVEKVLKKKEMKMTYILKRKGYYKKKHNKLNNLIEDCIQETKTIKKRMIALEMS